MILFQPMVSCSIRSRSCKLPSALGLQRLGKPIYAEPWVRNAVEMHKMEEEFGLRRNEAWTLWWLKLKKFCHHVRNLLASGLTEVMLYAYSAQPFLAGLFQGSLSRSFRCSLKLSVTVTMLRTHLLWI